MKGGRLGAQAFAKLRARLSERDVAIVTDVARLRLMSTLQIEALYFDAERHASALTAARTCRRVLNRLVRDRLLVRLQRRTVGGVWAGSASFIYALGPIGHRLNPELISRHRFREPTATFVAHTLAISDLAVALRQAERAKRLDILGLETEPSCWRPLGSHGSQVLRPDLFVRFGVGDYEYHAFVEIDLGTEGLPRLLAKCQTYVAYYDSNAEQATHGIFPKVVWLLDDDQRAQRLTEAIHRRRIRSELFTVASIDNALRALSEGDIAQPGVAS